MLASFRLSRSGNLRELSHGHPQGILSPDPASLVRPTSAKSGIRVSAAGSCARFANPLSQTIAMQGPLGADDQDGRLDKPVKRALRAGAIRQIERDIFSVSGHRSVSPSFDVDQRSRMGADRCGFWLA
jgi:hypothetical protein